MSLLSAFGIGLIAHRLTIEWHALRLCEGSGDGKDHALRKASGVPPRRVFDERGWPRLFVNRGHPTQETVLMRMSFFSASNLLIAFLTVDLLIVGIIESVQDIPYLLPVLKLFAVGLLLLLLAYGIRELKNEGSTFKKEFVRSWFVVALFPLCAATAILVPQLDKASVSDVIESEGYVSIISQNWSSGSLRSPSDERWVTIDSDEGDFKHLFPGSFIERHQISEGTYLQLSIRESTGRLIEARVEGVTVLSVEDSLDAINRKPRFLPPIFCLAAVIYFYATRSNRTARM